MYQQHWELLQNLIPDDIIGSIKANLEVGNITEDDAAELKELTYELYEHLYKYYEELGGYVDMKELLEGAMVLPLDKYRIRIDELETANAKLEADKAKAEAEVALLREQLAELKK